MESLNIALALLGGVLVVLNLTSTALTRRATVLSQPLIATAFGVIIGPAGLGLLVLSTWGDPITLLETVARLTVGFAVVGIALRVPVSYLRKRTTALATVLGPGMLAMWLVSGGLAYVFLDVPPWTALLLGAIVTPTDPVVANTIVTGSFAESRIPERLRRLLSTEAGANDGLAYPFVFLAILVLSNPIEGALLEWIVRSVLLGVIGAIGCGAVIGAIVGYLERSAERHDLLDEPSMLTVTVALTVAVLGIGALLGTSDILAAFAAGLAYNELADPRDEVIEAEVQESIKRLLSIPVFVLFGAALPWAEWWALGGAGLALTAGILIFRRLPIWLALHAVIPPLRTRRDALFTGWFGPIGIAALLYATISVRETGSEIGWIVGSLVISGSIVVHGVTATPLTRAYGRRVRDEQPDGTAAKDEEAIRELENDDEGE